MGQALSLSPSSVHTELGHGQQPLWQAQGVNLRYLSL